MMTAQCQTQGYEVIGDNHGLADALLRLASVGVIAIPSKVNIHTRMMSNPCVQADHGSCGCNTDHPVPENHLFQAIEGDEPGAHAVLLLDQAGWHLSAR
jgi:hypothetical protein